ncbi:hypothetical protein [Variovorax sp.]|jgi:hypothetical protein|uniref:hypothetical protein n=1 Tax=Variovorax sp. TaxID=1871043 RepID=UPI0037D9E48F
MHPRSLPPSNGARAFVAALCLAAAATGAAAANADCTASAAPDCYRAFEPPQAGGSLHYYASLAPGAGPTQALIAMHGHPRDAGKTFDAALRTVRQAGALERTLVVAPLFQVAADKAGKCSSAGVPAAQDGDLLWTCASWLEGGRAENGSGLSSFAAMDALVAELHRRWPGLRTVTLAGFSAGAQMVQHYIGFAADPPAASLALRYVVADPGTWLYFDAYRPFPPSDAAACPALHRWKYGTEGLPAHLGRDAAQARARYAAADIHYLQGELDTGEGKGTAYRVLDKSCAATAQGPYRLQRGLAYAQYDRTLLAPAKRREVTVVPGCAHDVACVFPSEAARAALLGTPSK